MLADPADTVVLLPARTRYEQEGGGTETSTERRIYFSPEIPGRRIGESKSEWEILMLLAERARPEQRDRIHFDDAQAIRDEIAKAVPFYDGIQHLKQKGDAMQWGGPLLCKDGVFPMPDGRARFVAVTPPDLDVPDGWFMLSSRRGKQFNSMVQGRRDPLTGAGRDAVLMSAGDAAALGFNDGDPVTVRSDAGELAGRVTIAPIKPRNVQVFWPEGNVLFKRGACDPVCGIPDYHTLVQIVPRAGSSVAPAVAGAAKG
jgi:predicted molibdopterin-dependent oxidoreductase YjgC